MSSAWARYHVGAQGTCTRAALFRADTARVAAIARTRARQSGPPLAGVLGVRRGGTRRQPPCRIGALSRRPGRLATRWRRPPRFRHGGSGVPLHHRELGSHQKQHKKNNIIRGTFKYKRGLFPEGHEMRECVHQLSWSWAADRRFHHQPCLVLQRKNTRGCEKILS